MVVQYPHLASVFSTTETQTDENGNWKVTGQTNAITVICRAEPQSGNGKIVNADGEVIDYNWIVYCPVDVPDMLIGSNVIVYGVTIITDTIKRFYRGQLNVRLWL